MHMQKIINDNIKNGDSPGTAKQTVEVLCPAFKIARTNRIVSHNPCEDVKIKMPNSSIQIHTIEHFFYYLYKVVEKVKF